jgi:hypothetical protein
MDRYCWGGDCRGCRICRRRPPRFRFFERIGHAYIFRHPLAFDHAGGSPSRVDAAGHLDNNRAQPSGRVHTEVDWCRTKHGKQAVRSNVTFYDGAADLTTGRRTGLGEPIEAPLEVDDPGRAAFGRSSFYLDLNSPIIHDFDHDASGYDHDGALGALPASGTLDNVYDDTDSPSAPNDDHDRTGNHDNRAANHDDRSPSDYNSDSAFYRHHSSAHSATANLTGHCAVSDLGWQNDTVVAACMRLCGHNSWIGTLGRYAALGESPRLRPRRCHGRGTLCSRTKRRALTTPYLLRAFPSEPDLKSTF